MSHEVKKLTADEQAFWDACVLATLPDTVTRSGGVAGKDDSIAYEVVTVADRLIRSRREREQAPATVTDAGWVSVKDRLPLNDRNVIVCNFPYLKQTDNEYMEVAYFTDGKWTSFISGASPELTPTHWRELPAPPK